MLNTSYMKNTPKYLLIALVLGLVLVAISINSQAQIPVPNVITINDGTEKRDPKASLCILHPETIIKGSNRIVDRVIFYTDGTGWPRPAKAVDFIKSEWPSNLGNRRPSAAAAAIQLSLSTPQKNAEAETILIEVYFPYRDSNTVPKITLANLIRSYLFTGNNIERTNVNFWLLEIVNSATNVDCNPWHPYTK